MSRAFTLSLTCSISLLVGSFSSGADKPSAVTRQFEVGLTLDMNAMDGTEKVAIAGTVRYLYAYERAGNEAKLHLNEMEMKQSLNGEVAVESLLNRHRFRMIKDGKTTDLKADNMPKAQRERAESLFGQPLCKITFDDNGSELSRTEVNELLTKQKAAREFISVTRCFHPPYHADRLKWEAPVEMSGYRNYIYAGNLTYEKTVNDKAERIAVKVHGDLVLDRAKSEIGEISGKCEITGEQTFDTKSKEWVTGN